MPDNKLHSSLPQNQGATWDEEDRIMVRMTDGTPVWLQGKAIQQYQEGKLDINTNRRTPEKQKKLEKMQEEVLRIAKESYPQI